MGEEINTLIHAFNVSSSEDRCHSLTVWWSSIIFQQVLNRVLSGEGNGVCDCDP